MQVRKYFHEYDGWRGIGILLVVATQVCFLHFSEDGLHPNGDLLSIAIRGTFAIDILFILSGFLICHTLIIRRNSLSGGKWLQNFYERRILRILPPCFAYLAIVTLLGSFGLLVLDQTEMLSSAFFYRNYLLREDSPSGWLTGHLWTLSVEEHFYLLFPISLLILSPRRALRIFPLFAIALGAWRIFDEHHRFVQSLGVYEFWGRSDIRADALLWGVWTNLLIHNKSAAAFLKKWLFPPLWYFLCFLCTCAVCYGPSVFQSLSLTMFFTTPLLAFIMLGTVLNENLIFQKVLRLRSLHWFARISYSVYLWKNLFLSGVLAAPNTWLSFLQLWPINILAVLMCGALGYYLIEVPCNALYRIRRQHYTENKSRNASNSRSSELSIMES